MKHLLAIFGFVAVVSLASVELAGATPSDEASNVPVGVTMPLRSPDPPQRPVRRPGRSLTAVASPSTAATAVEPSLIDVLLLPWIAFGSALLVIHCALKRRAPILSLVIGFPYKHRETLIFGGLTSAASISLGVAIGLLVAS
jgi:hypothetical protein